MEIIIMSKAMENSRNFPWSTMKKSGVLSLLIAVSGAAHAADITLNFTGNVVVTGCDISASSKTKAIAFGTVDLAKATAGGTGSSALKDVDFSLDFTNCVNLKNISLVMDTTKAVTGFADYYSIDEGAGKAGGLAVGIKGTDTAKTVQSPGKEVLWAKTAATNNIPFKATLYKTGAVTAGAITGLVNVTVKYN